MKLLFDENFERSVSKYFISEGHNVIHIGTDEFGTEDDVILNELIEKTGLSSPMIWILDI